MKEATPNGSSTNHDTQSDYINLGVLSHIESRFIPHAQTKARVLLELLSDGLVHSTQELMVDLDCDPRGPRQSLAGGRYGYWHIVNVTKQSKMGQYHLDPRHLSRLDGDDSKARNEAYLAYLKHSRKVSESGAAMLPRAIELEQQAQAKVDMDLEGAA